MICRWRHGKRLTLDAMPSDPAILGFSNRWQGAGIPHAIERRLASGVAIRALPPPYLLAAKLEAFAGRGGRDFMASRDFADVVALIDGREEILEEVAETQPELRDFLRAETSALLDDPRLMDGLFGALRPDRGSQARAELVVLPRLEAISR